MKIATTAGPAALVVTKLRTAAAWRTEIENRLADPRNPAAVQLRMMLDVLDEHERTTDGPADQLGVFPSPEFYTVYPIRHQLPRHYWVVGWLDEDGYRHSDLNLPVPTEEYLDHEWDKVCEVEGLLELGEENDLAEVLRDAVTRSLAEHRDA